MQTAIDKLDPQHLRVSGLMTAILGCLCGKQWTDKQIERFCETSDHFILAQHVGDIGFNEFISGADIFNHNIEGCISTAQLSGDERDWVRQRVNEVTQRN